MDRERLLADAFREGTKSATDEVAQPAGDVEVPGSEQVEVPGSEQVDAVDPVGPVVTGRGESSSGGGSEPSGASSGPVATSAPGAPCDRTLSEITIGTVGQQSGPVGAVVNPGVDGVQAWVAAQNAKGGLRCHPLRYIVADDGGDPSRNQALTRQLVEEEGVIALVFANAPITGEASQAYLESKGIPVIGSEGGSPWFFNSPVYFPQMAHAPPVLQGAYKLVGTVAKSQNKAKLGVIACVEVSVCADFGPAAERFAPTYELNLVYNATATIASPDFTSQCQAARNAGVELFMVALDGNSLTRVARSCASIGFRPQYFTIGTAVTLGVAKDPNLDGIVVLDNVLPWFDTSNEAVVEFREAMRQYKPGVPPDLGTSTGWVAAKLLELAAQDIDDPPTSKRIIEGLRKVSNNDLGGVTQPLTFTRPQGVEPRDACFWAVQASRGDWIYYPDARDRICL